MRSEQQNHVSPNAWRWGRSGGVNNQKILYFSLQIWIFHVILNKTICFGTYLQTLHPTQCSGSLQVGFLGRPGCFVEFLAKDIFWNLKPYPTQSRWGCIHAISVQIWILYEIHSKWIFNTWSLTSSHPDSSPRAFNFPKRFSEEWLEMSRYVHSHLPTHLIGSGGDQLLKGIFARIIMKCPDLCVEVGGQFPKIKPNGFLYADKNMSCNS